MLYEIASPTTLYIQNHSQDSNTSCGISRLLAAAVVNQGFRDLLLTDPEQALARGYQGEKFPLNINEKNLVLSIRAENLSDFALQIVSYQEDMTLGCSGQWLTVSQSAFALVQNSIIADEHSST
jgi:hypothetical protein